MTLRSVLCFITTSVAVLFIAASVLRSATVRAMLYPPSGPLAERLNAVDPADRHDTETDVLNDILKPGVSMTVGSKGPTSEIRQALFAARFDCFMVRNRQADRGVHVCRNDAAGWSRGGCRRDWLIQIDFVQGQRRTAIIESARTFVAARC